MRSNKDNTTTWLWETSDWGVFSFDRSKLDRTLSKFDFNNQISLSNSILFENSEDDEFVVNIQGLEALKTSEIEGEIYELPQIINSLKSGFHLIANTAKEENSESLQKRRKSVSSMMVDLYKHFKSPLSHETLHKWNTMLVGEDDVYAGDYRKYAQDMTVGSGLPGEEASYIAPPSRMVEDEMENFINWYNDTGPDGKNPLHSVIRAGLAHLYFVAIHPYDDGNGRIARALASKAISEANGEPTLISLSHAISDSRGEYYDALQKATKDHDIDAWLDYFCKTCIRAQEITKVKLYHAAVVRTIQAKHADNLNEHQMNAIRGMMEGGKTKKDGILSVSEYIQMNKPDIQDRAKQANKSFKEIAQEDIQQLVKLKILKKSSQSEGERYIMVYPTIPGICQAKNLPDASNDVRAIEAPKRKLAHQL